MFILEIEFSSVFVIMVKMKRGNKQIFHFKTQLGKGKGRKQFNKNFASSVFAFLCACVCVYVDRNDLE